MIALQNMRMSCDSTYLLDQETDFGVKADELATLIDEIYERPETKVVIFSQWTRMHEVLIRRFHARDWNYAYFHGGVDGGKRKALIDRFREDPACRAFLSTDAGGVGLNLQHAAVVVNVDLPWNPAVLEQRIGRVHRLGQTQPVRVVNFVAEGTIEQGMLSVIGFKKSLFSGVLDGGASEVFLGGSRLQRFIETVDAVTTRIPETTPEPPAAPSVEDEFESPIPGDGAARLGDDRAPTAQAASPANPLAAIVETGLSFLQSLRAGRRPADGDGCAVIEEGRGQPTALGALRIVRDPASGRAALNLPLPEPEVLDRALEAFSAFLESFRAR
jgi:hypothetical protein